MKKFQSFEDVANYLSTEEVPFTDNKDEIIRNIDVKIASPRTSYRKLTLVFTVFLILITSVVFAYDNMKKIKWFFESHDAIIQGELTDDKGNIVVQLGAMDPKNSEERKKDSRQRQSVSNRFRTVVRSLEDKLPDNKIALFIPVKNLESFTCHEILNFTEYYYTIEDTKNYIPDNSPIPKYVPEIFMFSRSEVNYNYEDFYEPYREVMTYKEYLEKLFKKAKEEEQDYYYEEFTRFDEVFRYKLEYINISDEVNEKNVIPWLDIIFFKGITATISDNGKGEIATEIIRYNSREYLKNENFYYTYIYIGDQLWTICVNTGLDIDEISKIIESIEAK